MHILIISRQSFSILIYEYAKNLTCSFSCWTLVLMKMQQEETTETEEPPPSKKFRCLSSILIEKKKEQGTSRSTTPTRAEQEEVTSYVSSKLDVDEDTDPLDFWIQNESTYPLLASLAFDLLTVPGSSIKCSSGKSLLNCWLGFLRREEPVV